MVKTRGPACSNEASGSLGQSLTFTSNHGRQTLRKKTSPRNPATPKQNAVRLMTRFLSQNWSTLSAAQQQTWANAYPRYDLKPYHKYLKYNGGRWANHLAPAQRFPAIATGPAPSTNFIALTALFHGFQASLWHFTPPPPWGIVIHVGPTNPFTPSAETIVAIIPPDNPFFTSHRQLDLPPVTVWVRQQQFVSGGTLRAIGAHYPVTPLG
jgi:hypothetical protein